MFKTFLLFSLFTFNFSFSTIHHVPEEYSTIQSGIDASVNGDTVLVQEGSYIENINFIGKNILLTSNYIFTQDSLTIEQTVIDGNQNGSVVTFENGEDSTAVLLGFSLINGDGNYTNLGGTSFYHKGGGVFCYMSSPTLSRLKVIGNNAENGGGIYCSTSNVKLSHLYINGNNSSFGGGIFMKNNSNPFFINVFISNNDAYNGGGVYTSNSSPYFKDVVIRNNFGDFGGGLIGFGSQIELINVEISQNLSLAGGGIYISTSTILLINNNLVSNHAEDYGGGIRCAGGNHIEILNSIFWENYPYNISYSVLYSGNIANISYSDFQGGLDNIEFTLDNQANWLHGNIDSDPMFLDEENGNYLLLENSPCIDTGTDFFVWDGDTLVDMSADEFIGSTPDMGAFEFYNFGDVNQDGEINIVDIIMTINFIISNEFNELADLNADGRIDILDIILIVEIILG